MILSEAIHQVGMNQQISGLGGESADGSSPALSHCAAPALENNHTLIAVIESEQTSGGGNGCPNKCIANLAGTDWKVCNVMSQQKTVIIEQFSLGISQLDSSGVTPRPALRRHT